MTRETPTLSESRDVTPLSVAELADRYREVRRATEWLCEPLEPEDCCLQSMLDASPTKWHLSHTSWFFETFVIKHALSDYRSPHAEYDVLFNSYYNALGRQHPRAERGLLSRPTLSDVRSYRAQVDAAMDELFAASFDDDERIGNLLAVIELGIHHEQQHQELILMDIKHLFSRNPLRPAYKSAPRENTSAVQPLGWIAFPEGIQLVGHDLPEFAFDNERPRHRVCIEPFRLADRLVTCGEYLAFIHEGGYDRAEFWLSDGWDLVQKRQWTAPLYWQCEGDCWHVMTLAGMRELDPAEPVCHVSFYEADAFARWANARLPTESEWETAARSVDLSGTFLESGRFHPSAANLESPGLRQMFGDVWEWTASPYVAYPGYRPLPNALGEYNGKFMCNQMVLRGGSCATPQSHIRPTYRNFFHPEKRWQFGGIRLAHDA